MTGLKSIGIYGVSLLLGVAVSVPPVWADHPDPTKTGPTSNVVTGQQGESGSKIGGLETAADQDAAIICGGCVSATHTAQGKGKLTPYGRIELDGIYSNRNTNPLDPGQFNGYATAAGKSSNSSSTFNPRYSVFGLRADRTDGQNQLTGVIESDFYSQTDNAGNISPRLRLAYGKYSPNDGKTSVTAGMDWTAIMGLHPNLIDFSIMGYNGNLWQRLPQVTVRHQINDNLNALVTAFRFERGMSAISTQVQRVATNGVASTQFDDPEKMPYIGTRLGYTGTGEQKGFMLATNVAYRSYNSAPGAGNSIPSGIHIQSYLVGAELVVPLAHSLSFSGELAYGQALGVEFFRFGQDRNLTTGKAIRTMTGWGELDYALNNDYTLIAGYGFDNPFNADVKSLTGAKGAADSQYLLNHRTYVTAVRHIWGDAYMSLEWNHLMTEWSSHERFAGDNFMLSTWYNF